MKMKNIILLLCLLATSKLFAQNELLLTPEQIEHDMLHISHTLHDENTLDSIVNRVIENSHLLKAIDHEVSVFDEQIKQNRRSWISSFALGVNIFSASTSLNGSNESVTTYGVLPNVGLNLSLNPEKLINTNSYVRQSKAKKEYTLEMREDKKMVLKKDILNLYYDYLSALESVNIRLQAYDARKQQEEYVNGMFTSGEASYSELLIAENQVHLAKEALIKTSVTAMKIRSEISVLTGLK